MELAPSVVRQIVLEEHGQIRRKLGKIEDLIQRKDYSTLQNAFSELAHFFLKHIQTEEHILRPVLKDLDAWGDVRVDRMNKEHAEQRVVVGKLDEMVRTKQPAEFVPEIQKFVVELYKDMSSEEAECLNPDVLKDDPISSGTCG